MQYKNKESHLQSDTEEGRIGLIHTTFEKDFEYFQSDRDRLISNCRMAWGVDYSQWPGFIVDDLLSQGRQVPTYNIIDRNLVGLAGTLLRNQFDVKYYCKNDNDSIMLQKMWERDKNQMAWMRSDAELLVYGLIQQGSQIMKVVYDNNGNPQIVFRTIPPWNVCYDPGWKSIFPEECNRAFTWTYMTPKEMLEIFPHKTDEMVEEKNRQSVSGPEYGENNEGVGNIEEAIESKWGGKHQVIEFHEMRIEKKWQEFDKINGKYFPEGSREEKKEYVERNKLGPDDISWAWKEDKKYWYTVICPTLTRNVYLEDTEHYIQINRLPLFPWGARRFNGQYKGIVDDLKDLQMNINKNEMAMTEFLQRCASGSMIAHPELVGNDDSKKKEFEKNASNPGAIMWADESAGDIRSLLEPTPRPQMPASIINNTERQYSLTDRLSLLNAAAEGRAESGRESGRLFQSKYQAGLIAQTLVSLGLKQHEFDKAKAYYEQAKKTYAGREMEIAGDGDNNGFVLNEMMALPSGEIGTRNDISKVEINRIDIIESPKGLNVKEKLKETYVDIWEATKDEPLARITALKNIIDNTEITDGSKNEIKNALDLSIKRYALEAQVSIQQLEAQMKSVMGQTQQKPPKEKVTRGRPSAEQFSEGTPEQGIPTKVLPGKGGNEIEAMIKST